METFITILRNSYEYAWGLPFLILISLIHIYLTLRTNFIQRKLFTGIKLSFLNDKKDNKQIHLKGEISNYRTFSLLICGTLGVGNILGIASAIYLGGPGAVFWCFLIGFFAMAGSYTETYLSLKYRKKSKDGRILAGPMYVIEQGFNSKWIAKIFAFVAIITSLGIGAFIPSETLLDLSMHNTFFTQLPPFYLSLYLAFITSIFIFGGLKSISNIAIFIAPIILISFIILAIAILIINYEYILPAIKLILTSAFTKDATISGIASGGLFATIKLGIAKGIFSNEALLGSSPVVAGATITRNNHRQALISESVIFWDTLVVCTLTGIIIVSSLLKNNFTIYPHSLDTPIEAIIFSFHQFPFFGKILLYILIFFLTYSALLVWSFYGERYAEYLFGSKIIIPYKIIFITLIAIAPFIDKNIIIELTDMLIVFMAFPNTLSTLFLSNIVIREAKLYQDNINLYDPENLEDDEQK